MAKEIKEEILLINGCQTCPLSEYRTNGEGWMCGNFKRKSKHIDINFIDNYYPEWCPLKKKSLKLILK